MRQDSNYTKLSDVYGQVTNFTDVLGSGSIPFYQWPNWGQIGGPRLTSTLGNASSYSTSVDMAYDVGISSGYNATNSVLPGDDVISDAGTGTTGDLIFLVAMSCLLGGLILVTVIGRHHSTVCTNNNLNTTLTPIFYTLRTIL